MERLQLLLATVGLVNGWSALPNTAKVVYIIRHGEKSSFCPFECLSEMGWARAYHLVSLFGLRRASNALGFRTPDAIFSADYADPWNCRDRHGWYRTQQTVAPLAASLGVSVSNRTGFGPSLCPASDWEAFGCGSFTLPVRCGNSTSGQAVLSDGMCCNIAAAREIQGALAAPDVSTILVAWESANIEWLASALGVPSRADAHWSSDDYDSILELRYRLEDAGALAFESFDWRHQGFSWLGPLAGCGRVDEP